MALDEWEVPDLTETPAIQATEATDELVIDGMLTASLINAGYGRASEDGVVIHFESGITVVVANLGGTSVHIQTYGIETKAPTVAPLASGRTDIERRWYISIRP